MKKQRQNKILEIIDRYEISTQEELKRRLEESGISVTQATLSRDINELRIKKISSEEGAYIYAAAKRPAVEYPPIFADSVVEAVYALNTVVIKCNTGMAQAVCATLDRLDCCDILGTIAGDDTIFALMKTEAAAAEFTEELNDFISG